MAKETKAVKEPLYSCESILKSERFSNTQKDLLRAVLTASKEYTLVQVDEVLKKELKRTVA